VRFRGEADMRDRLASTWSVAVDPGCVKTLRGITTRNFGLYGHAESKKTQKFVFRSALRPNQISFSHGQDPQQGRVIRYVDRMVMPIDVQGDHTPSDGGSFKVADCRLSSATSPISAATRRVPPFAAASFGFIAVPVILVAVHNLSRRTARQAVMLTSCQFLARQIPNKPSRPYTFCSARQQGQTVPP